MKLKTKKISLIIATAMFVFSGIFGLAEATAQESKLAKKSKAVFNKFEITNRSKYDVKVMIDDHLFAEVKAGETKEAHKDVMLRPHVWVGIKPVNEDLTFDDAINGFSGLEPTMYKREFYVLTDNDSEVEGKLFFTGKLNKEQNIYTIVIDADENNKNLQCEAVLRICN